MTKKKAPSASQTTTAGFTLGSDPAMLASQILAEAAADKRQSGWQSRISEQQRSVVEEVRDRWVATRDTNGIPASRVARALIAQMPECPFPSAKELANWLNRAR